MRHCLNYFNEWAILLNEIHNFNPLNFDILLFGADHFTNEDNLSISLLKILVDFSQSNEKPFSIVHLTGGTSDHIHTHFIFNSHCFFIISIYF